MSRTRPHYDQFAAEGRRQEQALRLPRTEGGMHRQGQSSQSLPVCGKGDGSHHSAQGVVQDVLRSGKCRARPWRWTSGEEAYATCKTTSKERVK